MNNSKRQATIAGQLAKVTVLHSISDKMNEAFAGHNSFKIRNVINQEIALLASYDRQVNQANQQRKAILQRLQVLSQKITEESK